MQAHQAEYGPRYPSEQEPCAHHDRQFHDTHLEVLLVDELVIEDVPAHVAQVEYIGCPVNADHHRTDDERGQYHLVCQGIEPGLRHGLLRELVLLLIHLQVVRDTGDGQNTGQLHDPPDEQLHGQQGVAGPGTTCRGDEDHHRHVGIEHVRSGDVLVVTSDAEPLPQQTGDQYRWEDEAHQFAGNQDDAEGDHHKAYQEQGRIDLEGTSYLTALDSQ